MHESNYLARIAFLVVAVATMVMLWSVVVQGDEPGRDALFHIERNKNANIIQYDAQLGPDGMLHSKEPVVGYWVRLADQGQIKQLTWLQKKFAYGFKAKLNRAQDTVTLDMAANLGRTIMVRKDGDDYRAISHIDGVPSYIHKIFIHATGQGLSTKVDYIELYGSAIISGDEQYEYFTP